MRDKSWRDTPFREIKPLEEFFSTPEPYSGGLSQEFQIPRRGGHTSLIGIHFTPLRASDGEILGLVGIFQDLTERRQIEARLRQADRLAAVGRLAAGLAHEVRNPLAALSGSIQLIKEEGVARPELLDIVLRETDRLKLVTGQFLDFAKPRGSLQKQCDLVALAEEAISLLEKSCDGNSAVTFTLQQGAERVMVEGAPDELKQVFWNLGLNAIQAMPSGGRLAVAIRQDLSERGTGWAAIEFTDTGRGIPAAELDRIFDPFYTTKPGGTGLGLGIARKIVDSLGGSIEVISREGGGATFRVVLKQHLDGGRPARAA
jgi:signal transduction histidine kinase